MKVDETCVLNSGSKGVSKVLSSHSAPLKSKKKFFTNKWTGQRCNKIRLCFQRAYLFSARINCFNSPLLYISRKGDLGLPVSNKFD